MTFSKICQAIVFLLVIVAGSGCSSMKVTKVPFGGGSVLVMPPTNAVQGGRVHPVASNSGSYLQQALVQHLDGRATFTASAYPPDLMFSGERAFSNEDAVRAAKKSGYQYCLVTRLGEFRDAAAMTFRDDFVTLNEARLIDVESNRDVWVLLQPYRASGGNIGSYYPLLNQLANKMTTSIVKSATLSGRPQQKHASRVYPTANVATPAKGPEVDQSLERLKLLKNARDQGLLTESEYRQKKNKIVDAL